MRILLVNANTTSAVTEQLGQLARNFAQSLAEIDTATPAFGVAYVQSRSEATISAHAVLTTIAECLEKAPRSYNACIIGCFGEPGLYAARELFELPIVGMAEAACLTAMQLASRFAIITAGERWPTMLDEILSLYGLSERCAAIRALPRGGIDLGAPNETIEQLAGLANKTLDETDADVIVLGGAALAPFASDLQRRIAVPVVDGLTAAVAQAIALGCLKPTQPQRGSLRKPSSQGMTRVAPVFARSFAERQLNPENASNV